MGLHNTQVVVIPVIIWLASYLIIIHRDRYCCHCSWSHRLTLS